MFNFNPGRAKKVILSIDGGGMRGAIPVAMLAEMEKQTGQTVQQMFDMVGGTSTGAVIAAAFGIGMSAQEVLDVIYKDRLPKAFPPRNLTFWLRYIAGGFRHFYKLEPFLETLGHLGAGKKIRDLQRPIVLMTTKDLRTSNTYYVVSKGPGAAMFADWPLSGAVGASGAAPVYFPPVLGNLVDGGVGVFSNPSLVTATEAMDYIGASEGFVDGKVIHISLGTGYQPNNLKDGEGGRYNILGWIQYVIADSLHDTSLQQVFVTKAIYGDRTDFRRYNPLLTRGNVRDVLKVSVKSGIDPSKLALDSTGMDDILLMEALGRAYANLIDWRKPGLMPWDTTGGHGKPVIEAVNWSNSPYR